MPFSHYPEEFEKLQKNLKKFQGKKSNSLSEEDCNEILSSIAKFFKEIEIQASGNSIDSITTRRCQKNCEDLVKMFTR